MESPLDQPQHTQHYQHNQHRQQHQDRRSFSPQLQHKESLHYQKHHGSNAPAPQAHRTSSDARIADYSGHQHEDYYLNSFEAASYKPYVDHDAHLDAPDMPSHVTPVDALQSKVLHRPERFEYGQHTVLPHGSVLMNYQNPYYGVHGGLHALPTAPIAPYGSQCADEAGLYPQSDYQFTPSRCPPFYHSQYYPFYNHMALQNTTPTFVEDDDQDSGPLFPLHKAKESSGRAPQILIQSPPHIPNDSPDWRQADSGRFGSHETPAGAASRVSATATIEHSPSRGKLGTSWTRLVLSGDRLVPCGDKFNQTGEKIVSKSLEQTATETAKPAVPVDCPTPAAKTPTPKPGAKAKGRRRASESSDESYRPDKDLADQADSEDGERSCDEYDLSFEQPEPATTQEKVVAALKEPLKSRDNALQSKKLDTETAKVKSSRNKSSNYRGVTKHRRSGRFEAHLWIRDLHRQVYLGGYETEEHAAEAYDVAALKSKGLNVKTNFKLTRYTELIKCMDHISMEELIMAVRRQSQGFSRGSSTYRGVTHHPSGRWEARIGVPGSKHIYLGLHDSGEEAAKHYDRALVRLRGQTAATNFTLTDYRSELGDYHRAQQEMLVGVLDPKNRGDEFEEWVKTGYTADSAASGAGDGPAERKTKRAKESAPNSKKPKLRGDTAHAANLEMHHISPTDTQDAPESAQDAEKARNTTAPDAEETSKKLDKTRSTSKDSLAKKAAPNKEDKAAATPSSDKKP